MIEKKLLGDKTKGGFYKKTKERHPRRSTPRPLEYRAEGEGEVRRRSRRRQERRRRRASACGSRRRRRRPAGAVRVEGAAASLAYAARRIGEIADDVVNIDSAMKWGYGWELGPFETWDALGFAETRRAHGEGRLQAARLDQEDDGARARPASTAARPRADLLRRRSARRQARARRRARDPLAALRARATRCSRTTAPRRGTSATACLPQVQDQGELHRRRRHRDDPRRRVERARARLPRLVIGNQGEPSASARTSSWSSMAAGQKHWATDRDRRARRYSTRRSA